jgi:hypothetical protein
VSDMCQVDGRAAKLARFGEGKLHSLIWRRPVSWARGTGPSRWGRA